MKTLVLGMGNTILCDAGVGIYVVQEAAKRYQRDDVDFTDASVGGMRLLDIIWRGVHPRCGRGYPARCGSGAGRVGVERQPRLKLRRGSLVSLVRRPYD